MVRRICELTVTLDLILQLVLCSLEDFSFNSICLNVLEGIKQFYLLMWFKKTRLETPFKCNNVKAFIKTSNCETWSFISLRKFRKLQHFLCFLVFSDQTIARYFSTAAAFGNSVFLNGNSCQLIGACIFMTANETRDLMWMGSPIQNNC